MRISLIDVQVQGEVAPLQLVSAIEQFNQAAEPPEVLVITRGGGSADDLQAFSTEQVTRAVAASRIPTLVAIGHEVDVSLAELAADQRASTPSNAAELLVPDRRAVLAGLSGYKERLWRETKQVVKNAFTEVKLSAEVLHATAGRIAQAARHQLELRQQVLGAFDPQMALQRGYALVRLDGSLVRTGKQVKAGDSLNIQFSDASVTASVKQVRME
jgi:exodeoxyribonuclease VII large subunit